MWDDFVLQCDADRIKYMQDESLRRKRQVQLIIADNCDRLNSTNFDRLSRIVSDKIC